MTQVTMVVEIVKVGHKFGTEIHDNADSVVMLPS
jgi:hypothetical protein